ncbi:MAG: hypothetical protein J6Y08_11365 [Clostridiales bacterium]|nr:hypothetical protein [Clostridiales bacterium]
MAQGRRPDNKRPKHSPPKKSGNPSGSSARPVSGNNKNASPVKPQGQPARAPQGKMNPSAAPASRNKKNAQKRPMPQEKQNPDIQARQAQQNRSGKKRPPMAKNPSSEQKMPVNARTSERPQDQEPMIRPLFGDEVAAPSVSERAVAQKEPAKEKLSWSEKRKLAAQKKEEAKQAAKKPSILDEIMEDPAEERRKHTARKRRRDALTSAFNCLLCVVILIGVLVIAVLYVVDYVAAKPTFAFATEGTIEHTVGATALIARHETVIDSTHTGSLLTQTTEGSRVSKGQLLAMVIPSGMEATVEDLRNVEQQIVEIERELMAEGKGIGAKTIFSDVNNDILPIITMVRQDALLGNISNMTSYSSSIRVLMEKRDVDMENIDFENEQLNVLRDSEMKLRNQLETQANSIYALIPGIVSYKLDGHENDVNYTKLMGMTDSEFDTLLKDCNNIITGDLDVNAGDPVLRIIQNDVQYFACILEGVNSADFGLEKVYTIRIPSEGIAITDCKIVRSNLTEDGLLVVFETSNQVERLLDRRTVDIEIVQKTTQDEDHKGVRIPISSLVDADYDRMIATIFVNQSGYARGYTVRILDYDREYAIVAPIDDESNIPSVSTIVITNPYTVKEGDKVEK